MSVPYRKLAEDDPNVNGRCQIGENADLRNSHGHGVISDKERFEVRRKHVWPLRTVRHRKKMADLSTSIRHFTERRI